MTFDFKGASSTDLKKQYDEIAKRTKDDQFFTRKELRHLPQILSEGEQVLAFTSGLMNGSTWLITLTDRRVIFLDKGMFYGLKQASIDLDKVNAVECKTGIIFGKILIEDGASKREIDNVLKRTVVPFTNMIRDAMEIRKRPAAPVAREDVISKLERLAKLRDDGVLTADEFAAQKAKILA